MSDEQRQQYLTRRRANYRERIRRGKQVVDSNQPTNLTTPLQEITNTSRVIWLSTIRQIARNTSHPRFVPDQTVSYTSSTRRGTNSNTAPANNLDGANMNGSIKLGEFMARTGSSPDPDPMKFGSFFARLQCG
ncbi:hypothetical protein PIB30_095095 [Stylosanthes scabra]|uniref:BZIP domain-containing protein n=1 Tax=Stylosanthes scabra TaxID=79078 RepID=A0ABU6SY25_9FABA|nr:hypothetical protein [Stylosanthes scabra]